MRDKTLNVFRIALMVVLAVAMVEVLPAQGADVCDEAQITDLPRVIVRFKEGTTLRRRESILRGLGAERIRHFELFTDSVATVPDARLRGLLRAHPEVLMVIPNRPIRKAELEIKLDPVEEPGPGANEGKRGGGGGGGGSSQIIPEGVKRIGATPGALPVTGVGVRVAVVDTGMDRLHADFDRGTFSGVDPQCYFDPTIGTSCEDDNGHGTHVAGIIGATNNGIGVVGVAPDVRLFSVKVLDLNGDGSDETVIHGLDWIINNLSSTGIRVVNLSLSREGTLNDNPPLRQRFQTLMNMGVISVASADNCASREVRNVVPAGYPEVMAVASTTALAGTSTCTSYPAAPADMLSHFSTDGRFDSNTKIGVTISAPGQDLETRVKSGTSCIFRSQGILSLKNGGGTERRQGTSMSAPHVAGVAALRLEWLGTSPGLDEVRGKVRGGAARIGVAPLDPPIASCDSVLVTYTFDGEREGILQAAVALLPLQ